MCSHLWKKGILVGCGMCWAMTEQTKWGAGGWKEPVKQQRGGWRGENIKESREGRYIFLQSVCQSLSVRSTLREREGTRRAILCDQVGVCVCMPTCMCVNMCLSVWLCGIYLPYKRWIDMWWSSHILAWVVFLPEIRRIFTYKFGSAVNKAGIHG